MNKTSPGPPRLSLWVLTKLSAWIERYSLIDDLEHEYQEHVESGTEKKARAWFRLQILRILPSIVLYSLYRSAIMIKNYATIALRKIRRQKVFSFINIVGLAIGLSLCLFVFRMVVSMHSVDVFHQNKARIHRVISEITAGNRVEELATAPLPLAYELEQISAVEAVVRIKKDFGGPAVLGNKILPVQGYYADVDFFRIFSFDLTEGDPLTALREPFSLVLTRGMAVKFFGNSNPMGRILSFKGIGDFKITGVTEDVSKLQSHMRFECLASFATVSALERQQVIPPILNDWSSFYTTYVYFLQRDGSDLSGIEKALPGIVERHYQESAEIPIFSLQALTNISPGRNLGNFLSTPAINPQTPLLLSSITFLITLIACFNYANLSLAKALARAKEVGIRKAIGANRGRLITQFIGEAVTYSVMALFLALFLLEFVLPRVFERMPFVRGEVSGFGIAVLPFGIILSVLTGLLAGIVPAILFSKFDPAVVLMDISKARVFSKLTLRRGLVVFQFIVSFFFIITTIVIFKQIRFEERIDKGFQPENVINVELQGVDYALFKQEASSHPSITGISASSSVLCTGSRGIMKTKRPEETDFMEIDGLIVDESFVTNMGIPLLAGQTFPVGANRETESFTLINQAAVERLQFESPQDAVGKSLMFGGDRSLEIIGVVANFASQSLSSEIRPLLLRILPKYFLYANIRTTGGDPAPVLEFLAEKWKKLEPYLPFRSGFLEDQIADYQSEGLNLLKGVSFVAFMAVTIAFFGLLGMVLYDIDAKRKEIGVRKILGASTIDIITVLSRKFVFLLVFAAILATPAAWFFNNMILQSSARRISLGPGIFLLGLAIMLGLGLATIFSQTFRAAIGNPVESLRYE